MSTVFSFERSSAMADPNTAKSKLEGKSKEELLELLMEEQKRNRQFVDLQRFCEQLPAILSSDIRRIVDAIYSFIPLEVVNLFVIRDDKFLCVASNKRELEGKSFARTGILQYVVKSRRAVNLIDPRHDWRFGGGRDSHEDVVDDLISIMAVPVGNANTQIQCVLEVVNCTRKRVKGNTDYVNKAATPRHAELLVNIQNNDADSKVVTRDGFNSNDEMILSCLAQATAMIVDKIEIDDSMYLQKKQTNALHQIVGLHSMQLDNMTKGQLINSSLEDAIAKIIRACYMICDVEHCMIYLVDDETRELVSTSKKSLQRRVALSQGGIAGFVATSGQVVNCPDTSKDLRFDKASDEAMGFNTQTVLAVPIKDRTGRTIGVLKLANRRHTAPRMFQYAPSLLNKNTSGLNKIIPFSDDDQQLVFSLGMTAAGIIEQAKLFEEAVKGRQQTEALLRITDLMQIEIGTEKIIPKIIESAYKLIQAERITLFTMEEVKKADGTVEKKLVCRVSADPTFVGVKLEWNKGIVGQVARAQKTINITDAYQDERFNSNVDKKTSFTTKALLTVPIIDWKFQCVGVIQAVNKKTQHVTNSQNANFAFSKDDVSNLEHLATSAGIVLRKAALYESAMNANRKVGSLMHILRVIGDQKGTMDTILAGILNICRQVTQAQYARIFFVASDSYFSLDKTVDRPLSFSVAGLVARLGTAINIRDVSQDTRYEAGAKGMNAILGYDVQSLLCLPIVESDGRVLALLHVSNKTVEDDATVYDSMRMRTDDDFKSESVVVPFNSEDEELLQALGFQIRSTIRRFLHPALRQHHNIGEEELSLIQMYSRNDVETTSLNRASSTESSVSSASSRPPSGIFERKRSRHNRKRTMSVQWPAKQIMNQQQLLILQDPLNFNPFEHSDNELLEFTLHIFQDMGLLASPCIIDLGVFKSFALSVRNSYRDNPFHSWKHGVAALHFSYLATKNLTKASKYLKPHDVLALMVASLCHDVDHPGVTNSFEISSSSDLALTHNDLHVLENHHAHTTFSILKKHNIFANLNKAEYKEVRKVMIQGILATDLSSHFEDLKRLDEIEADADVVFDIEEPADRQRVINTLIHTSDLSAQTFATPIAATWEKQISKEFKAQAVREKALGIPVAPFMTNLEDPYRRNQLQVNFITFVLEPWWKGVSRIFPGLTDNYERLLSNKAYYAKCAQRPVDEADAAPAK